MYVCIYMYTYIGVLIYLVAHTHIKIQLLNMVTPLYKAHVMYILWSYTEPLGRTRKSLRQTLLSKYLPKTIIYESTRRNLRHPVFGYFGPLGSGERALVQLVMHLHDVTVAWPCALLYYLSLSRDQRS